jgi:hypothetical protein
MAGSVAETIITAILVILVVAALIYLVDPTFFGLVENFANPPPMMMAQSTGMAGPGQMNNPGRVDYKNVQGNTHVAKSAFEDMASPDSNVAAESFEDGPLGEGPADFGNAEAPEGCYPRDQLTPNELLPKDANSVWAEQNPMGPGSLKGKNFLSAGALLGVNTVGQSLRNANWQLRSEPPNPQVPVSIFNQSTIQPDVNRRPLEIN